MFLFFSFIFFCCFLVFFLFSISFFFVYQTTDNEKVSTYECGFNPTEDARNKFEVKFFLVGILFIMFDLELSFMFPWVLVVFKLDEMGLWVMFFFMLILTIVLFMNIWKVLLIEKINKMNSLSYICVKN